MRFFLVNFSILILHNISQYGIITVSKVQFVVWRYRKMRLQITKSANAECFYVVKSVYKDKKRTNKVIEKLGNLEEVKQRADS